MTGRQGTSPSAGESRRRNLALTLLLCVRFLGLIPTWAASKHRNVFSRFWRLKSEIKVSAGLVPSGRSEEAAAPRLAPRFWRLPAALALPGERTHPSHLRLHRHATPSLGYPSSRLPLLARTPVTGHDPPYSRMTSA